MILSFNDLCSRLHASFSFVPWVHYFSLTVRKNEGYIHSVVPDSNEFCFLDSDRLLHSIIFVSSLFQVCSCTDQSTNWLLGDECHSNQRAKHIAGNIWSWTYRSDPWLVCSMHYFKSFWFLVSSTGFSFLKFT